MKVLVIVMSFVVSSLSFACVQNGLIKKVRCYDGYCHYTLDNEVILQASAYSTPVYVSDLLNQAAFSKKQICVLKLDLVSGFVKDVSVSL